jgi:hypothetical protein
VEPVWRYRSIEYRSLVLLNHSQACKRFEYGLLLSLEEVAPEATRPARRRGGRGPNAVAQSALGRGQRQPRARAVEAAAQAGRGSRLRDIKQGRSRTHGAGRGGLAATGL